MLGHGAAAVAPAQGKILARNGSHHAENLVVAPSWIESCLEDKIRALVKGVVCLVVVKTSQIAEVPIKVFWWSRE